MNTYEQGKKKVLDTFTVKGFKTWEAREGVGAQTTLYRDGKKIGTCTDEGNGGEVDFRADTTEFRTMVWDFIKDLPSTNTLICGQVSTVEITVVFTRTMMAWNPGSYSISLT